MPVQARPFWPGGPNDVKVYGMNLFLLDRFHPNPNQAAAAAAALRVAGYTAAQIDELPRFIVLAPELKDDEQMRDVHRAMYEAYGVHTQFPAQGAQIRGHLAALGYGGYQHQGDALQAAAERVWAEEAQAQAETQAEATPEEPAQPGASAENNQADASAPTQPEPRAQAGTGRKAKATTRKEQAGARAKPPGAARASESERPARAALGADAAIPRSRPAAPVPPSRAPSGPASTARQNTAGPRTTVRPAPAERQNTAGHTCSGTQKPPPGALSGKPPQKLILPGSPEAVAGAGAVTRGLPKLTAGARGYTLEGQEPEQVAHTDADAGGGVEKAEVSAGGGIPTVWRNRARVVRPADSGDEGGVVEGGGGTRRVN
jgi:hypothetical protein